MKALIFALLVVSVLGATAQADPPNFITYQGRLKDTLGNPVDDNAYAVTFSLYSVSSGGSPIWTEVQPITTTNGLFSTILGATTPFDTAAFSDSVRYLGIKVGADPEISPRSRLASVPFALSANSGWIDDGGVVRLRTTTDWVGIGTSTPVRPFQLYDAAGLGFLARIGSPNPNATITEFANASAGATWELSVAGSNGVPGWGVQSGDFYFYRQGTSFPNAVMTAGGKVGLGTALPRARLEAVSPDTMAAFFGASYGDSKTHVVHAEYTGPTADAVAVYGKSKPTDFYGIGGVFEGGYIGAKGLINQDGPYEYSGVLGEARGAGNGKKIGVYGYADGAGGQKRGMYAEAFGDYPNHAYAIEAQAGGQYSAGLFSHVTGDASTAVLAESTDGPLNFGVDVWAHGTGENIAIKAEASGGTTNTAATLWGNVDITGTLSKSAGSFKIDHPLDPEHKYLQHSFVESPDMMNIYNGNIVTDASGDATVTLPDWFEALNKDCRYQLTVIGEFAQAIVSSKVSNNRFSIRTDKPNVEVSWQVTGIRHDPYADAHRIQVEVAKTGTEIGRYANPELFGKGREMSVNYRPKVEEMRAPAASSREALKSGLTNH